MNNAEYKIEKILELCKGHEDFLWAAKIISIILECDFRDAKQAIENYSSHPDNQ